MKGTPGVDMTTGSLGHGLAAGIGMALSARIDKLDFRVWVLLGDGECQEGLVWEAAMAAGVYRLANLTAIVDANGWQSCDSVVCTMPLEPFAEKWRAFGWNVVEIDGHDMAAIVRAYREAAAFGDGPTVILARTVKGKGVSFMENDNSWHQRALTEAEYAQALAELEGGASDGR
jgi:transketolase